jgi:cytochrome b
MPALSRIRVWDLPTRLFHWALVICVVGAYVTVKLGGLWMDWHTRFGMAALALIAFRLIWGLLGPRYARFSQFVRGPRTVLRYLRNDLPPAAGHNPLGACSVIALLLVIGVQASSGLFANDDVLTAGPLAFLSDAWSSRMTWLHNANEWVIIALVGLHVAAIAWYQLVLRKNLGGPMIHGDVPADAHEGSPPAQDSWTLRLAALILFAALCGLVWWLTTLAPADDFSFM